MAIFQNVNEGKYIVLALKIAADAFISTI